MSPAGVIFLVLMAHLAAIIISAEMIGDRRTLTGILKFLGLLAGFALYNWLFK